jgi:hypothetical protein
MRIVSIMSPASTSLWVTMTRWKSLRLRYSPNASASSPRAVTRRNGITATSLAFSVGCDSSSRLTRSARAVSPTSTHRSGGVTARDTRRAVQRASMIALIIRLHSTRIVSVAIVVSCRSAWTTL